MATATATERRQVMPRVNILDREDSVVIEADMPGVTRDNVEVNMEGDELTILGHKTRAAEGDNGRAIVSERAPFDYRRTFVISRAIDREKVDANMKDGVLRLTLHKSDQFKPRRISVN